MVNPEPGSARRIARDPSAAVATLLGERFAF